MTTTATAAPATAVFFALQFFLRCSFFCAAVFFALLRFLELCEDQALLRVGGHTKSFRKVSSS